MTQTSFTWREHPTSTSSRRRRLPDASSSRSTSPTSADLRARRSRRAREAADWSSPRTGSFLVAIPPPSGGSCLPWLLCWPSRTVLQRRSFSRHHLTLEPVAFRTHSDVGAPVSYTHLRAHETDSYLV